MMYVNVGGTSRSSGKNVSLMNYILLIYLLLNAGSIYKIREKRCKFTINILFTNFSIKKIV